MIKDLLNLGRLLRSIAAVLPFILLCLRTSKINLPRKERCDQYLCAFAALLYCIPAMIFADKIAVGMVTLMRRLSSLLAMVPFVGKLLARLVQTLNLGYGVQLLANTTIVAGYCVVKQAILKPSRKLKNTFPKLYENLVHWFYEKDELHGGYFLQEHCLRLRQLLGVFYQAMIVYGVFDMILCLNQPDYALNRYPMYPVFGIILMGECAFFMGGLTRHEDRDDDGDEPETLEQSGFAELLQRLQELFGDRILYDGEMAAQAAEDEQANSMALLEELCAGSNLEQLVGNYFRHLQECGYPARRDGIYASARLMQDHSVLFYNPFYRDVTPYIMLPVMHRLLNHQSILVVSGRSTGDQDVKNWIQDGIQDACNLENLWRVRFLKEEDPEAAGREPDVGILSFNDLYDLDLQQAHQSFFGKVSMVILLEPSNLMGTGQVGLRSICQQCERPDKKLVYAICDRNCDGMVDALSHVLRDPITEVMASPASHAPYYEVMWAAEGESLAPRILPKVSRYFGVGLELGAVYMKMFHGQMYWYAGDRFPLADLRWSAEQYTRALSRYIGCPPEQVAIDERIQFVNGLWQAGRHEDAFVVVEDEFYNLFEVVRNFGSRAGGTGFVNVLSGNYMLRDYMCANAELFENDPKAIPTFCPDYARTERNLTLRLLMLMAASPRSETVLRRELDLSGIEDHDVFRAIRTLVRKYTSLPEDVVQACYRSEPDPLGPGKLTRKYLSVSLRDFHDLYQQVLLPAYFIVENEQSARYYMGARMMGQVCQTLLPGQFFCYDGRYYQVQDITDSNGILVRRAADHLNGRVYYRQLRNYSLQNLQTVGGSRDLRGIALHTLSADIFVETDAYYAMESRGDFTNAHLVHLESAVPMRVYQNKVLLGVELPDAAPEVVFTLCALLNELFLTLYPNEEGFLAAATNLQQPQDDMQRAIVPGMECNGTPMLFIIEDCFMDLGVVTGTERGFQRILEIVTDYLSWYLDPARARRSGETMAGPGSTAASAPEEGEAASADRTPALHDDAVPEGQTVEGEDDETLQGGVRKKTVLREYLTYGGERDAEFLALPELLEYLCGRGFDHSTLHNTRVSDPEMEEYLRHLQDGDHVCDFCSAVMEPGKYEILKDGRERCPECSKTAVRTVRQARKLFFETRQQMEEVFGISIRTPIRVRMLNAKAIAKEFGEEFVATKGFDSRAVGFARNTRNGRKELCLETGAPAKSLEYTIVHELTHIWQYENWGDTVPNDEAHLHVYEGMAVWAEVQYMLSTGDEARAKRYSYGRLQCDDEYGRGLKVYMDKYRFTAKKNVNRKKTPFGKVPPL